jgi:hypothetical protein
VENEISAIYEAYRGASYGDVWDPARFSSILTNLAVLALHVALLEHCNPLNTNSHEPKIQDMDS